MWIAAGIWLASVALAVVGAIDASRHEDLLAGGVGLSLVVALSAVATAGIGAIVAGKTGNLVGWLLAKGGLVLAAGLVAALSVVNACATDGSPATWLVVVALGGTGLWWACLTTSVALFPSGRVGRGRSTTVLMTGPALAWVGAAAATVGALARPAASARSLGLGVCAGGGAPSPQIVAIALLGAGFVVATGVTLRRVTRLRDGERRQLMPVAAVAAVEVVLLIGAALIEPWARPYTGDAPWVVAAWVGAGLGLPVAVAVSVIRHRTFGIFRLVGFRTDYRLWTVGLAAAAGIAAIGVAWGLTALLGLSDEPAVVGLVTLAAAALIFPFWWRRQGIVDARFEQHREDPAAVVEAIAAGSTGTDADRVPMRGPVFDLLGPFAPIVIVEGEGGMRFAVRTDDREIGRHTFVNGAYDLETMRCALRLLQTEGGRTLEGRTVLDVGANIGVSIVPLMRLFGAERGVAFEPAPDAVEMLELNVSLNDLGDRVRVMAMGLSDRDGTLELALSADNFGDHRLRASDVNATDDTSGRRTVTVQVRRLDGLVHSGEVDGAAVGLVWLDVQGHEGHVLAGAHDLLASGVPVVTEFWPSAMRRAGGLEAFHDVVRSCFARVVDVRAAQREGRPEAVPAARIEEMTEGYAEPAAFTDLLLLP